MRPAFRAPGQNPFFERFNGTLRREFLDHVVVLSATHLRRLLREFLSYPHDDRSHLGLEKDCPVARPATPRPVLDAELVALPRVGGVHHRYVWRESA